jgi:hypothetical protein
MDYNPTNIVPKGWKQGDFYSTTLGPYDYWAIEYGYKPFSGGTSGELAELKKIASRSGDPALQYATDEDTRDIDPDPDSNLWDLGNDSLEFARMRLKIVQDLLPASSSGSPRTATTTCNRARPFRSCSISIATACFSCPGMWAG